MSGFPKITTEIGSPATNTYTPNTHCSVIEANSSCILTYDVVEDNPGLKPSEPREFVDASYLIIE